MLLRFRVSNYLSFKEQVELSMGATAIKEYADTNIFQPQHFELRLIKSAAIYGANSAGKSNVIKAVEFMKSFVLNSAKEFHANEKVPVENFKLNTLTSKRPSSFEIEFLKDGKMYFYGFHVDKERIWKEYLYEIKKTKNAILFQRVYDDIMVVDGFEEAKGLERKTRSNALFLSVIAQFNGTTATRIIRWFQSLTFLYDNNFKNAFNHSIGILSDERRRVQLLKILRIANLGFDDIVVRRFKLTDEQLKDIPEQIRTSILANVPALPDQVLTFHKRFDQNNKAVGQVEFNFYEEESFGTQKYFSIAGYVLDTLTQGGVLFIDELDARLHPLLSLLIVQFFNNDIDNSINSQLIFTTHNTNLLSAKILRRDQIYLINKDEFGGSKMENLMAKDARADASFEKDYLLGKYQAIPFNKEDAPKLDLYNDDGNPTLF
jgi:uncharacterized protein